MGVKKFADLVSAKSGGKIKVPEFASTTNPVQVSKRFWDKLSAAEQKLLQDAATEAQNYQRVASRDVSAKAVSELKAKGMIFNEISAPEQARMRAAVKPVHDKFAASYDPAAVQLFKSELERVSKF